jgi:hypothetical protein
MKMDYSQLSICDTNSRHSQAELDGTGDPDVTPAQVSEQRRALVVAVEWEGEGTPAGEKLLPCSKKSDLNF